MKTEQVIVVGNGYSYIVKGSKQEAQQVSNCIDNQVNELMNEVYLNTDIDQVAMRTILTIQAWKQVASISRGFVRELTV